MCKYFFLTFVALILCETCNLQELEVANFHRHVQRMYEKHGKNAMNFVLKHLQKAPHVIKHTKRITNDHIAPRVINVAKKAMEVAPSVIKGTGRLFAKLFQVASYNMDIIPTLDRFIKTNSDDSYASRNVRDTGNNNNADPYARNSDTMQNNYVDNQDNYGADAYSAPTSEAAFVDTNPPYDSADPPADIASENPPYALDSENDVNPTNGPAAEYSTDTAYTYNGEYSPPPSNIETTAVANPWPSAFAENTGIQANQGYQIAPGYFPPNVPAPSGMPVVQGYGGPPGYPQPLGYPAAPVYPYAPGFPAAAGFPVPPPYPVYPPGSAVQPFPPYSAMPPSGAVAPSIQQNTAVSVMQQPIPEFSANLMAPAEVPDSATYAPESASTTSEEIVKESANVSANAENTSSQVNQTSTSDLLEVSNSSDAQAADNASEISADSDITIASASATTVTVSQTPLNPLMAVNGAAVYPAYPAYPSVPFANPAYPMAQMNPAAQGIYAPQYIAYPANYASAMPPQVAASTSYPYAMAAK